MSAYVVSKRHIDAMVTAGLQASLRERSPLLWSTPNAAERLGVDVHRLDETNADEIGAMLWTENVRSVRARYPGDGGNDLPGPIHFTPGDADAYTFERLAVPLTPVELLKALDGYEYQTCEHDGWRDPANVARAFCQRLRSSAIHSLPGYDNADTWEVSDERPALGCFAAALRR